jgi:hypothetical protein
MGLNHRPPSLRSVFFHPFGLSELPPHARIGRDLNTATSHRLATTSALPLSYRSIWLLDEREVGDLLPNQRSVARGDADSHQLTIPRSVGLPDGCELNVLFLELLFELQEIELALRAQSNRTRIRRQVARAAFARSVNELRAEIADGDIEATNTVVGQIALNGRNRSTIFTCRQQRHLRGTRSVKLDRTSWNQP